MGVGVVGHWLCGSCHTWVCVMPWGLCGFFADLGLLDLCCGVGLGLGYVVGLLGF